MLERPVIRRTITVTLVYVSLALLTILLPLVLTVTVAVDLFRWTFHQTHGMATRIAVFLWVYLVGEAWALVVVGVLGLLPKERSIDTTFKAQRVWLDWNFEALRMIFGLDFAVEGLDEAAPGPFVLLSRHASIIDTMLPGRYVAKPHGIRLRYVLKKELLVDPALDIAGNRLPNHFLDRSGDSSAEVEALRELARELGTNEAVLIYPEGTRYSEAKRIRYTEKVKEKGGKLAEIADGFHMVLPPRPAGTVALIESTVADVVVLAHRGLEGFARVKDLWSGRLVGSTIYLRFWRLPRSELPQGRDALVEWLFKTWAEVDSWVLASKPSRA